MNKAHHHLSRRYHFYRTWHEHPYHQHHHWLVAFLALLIGSYAIAGAWQVTLEEQELLVSSAATMQAQSASTVGGGGSAPGQGIPNLNCDTEGKVDVFDLALFMYYWGSTTPHAVPCADGSFKTSDLNGDGTVNIADLVVLTECWGSSPTKPECGGTVPPGESVPARTGLQPENVVTEVGVGLDADLTAPTTLEGTLLAIHADDFDRKQSQEFFLLQTDGGQFFDVSSLSGLSLELHGSRMRVKNIKTESNTSLGSLGSRGVITGGEIMVVKKAQTPRVASTGIPRVAILLVNFENDPQTPWTKDFVNDFYFNSAHSVSNYFKEVSYGKTSLSGEVFGWYTMPRGYNICNYFAEVIEAADADVDFSRFDRVVFASTAQDCPYAGAATLDAVSLQTNDGPVSLGLNWINGAMDEYVTTHEQGHNYGIGHANSWRCTPVGIYQGGGCQSTEYGNPNDVMGGGWPQKHMNAVFKHHLGWLDDGRAPLIEQSGTYRLTPLEVETQKWQTLRLRRSADETYYLEYRRPIGFDQDISPQSGLLINFKRDSHLYPWSYLTYANSSPEQFLLEPGNTFSDLDSGITIGPILTADDNEIVFAVNRGEPQCIQHPLSISNYNVTQYRTITEDLYLNQNFNIDFELANGDNPVCDTSSVFQISIGEQAPSDWQYAISPADEISLSPGQSTAVSIQVEIPLTVQPGSYYIPIIATNKSRNETVIAGTTQVIIIKRVQASLDPTSPGPSAVAVGAKDVVFTKVLLTGGSWLTDFFGGAIGSDSENAFKNFSNIRIYDGNRITRDTLLGKVDRLQGTSQRAGAYVDFKISIPPQTSKVLTLVSDVDPEASGSGRLGIQWLNSNLGLQDLLVYGNIMTFVESQAPDLTVSVVGTWPSTSTEDQLVSLAYQVSNVGAKTANGKYWGGFLNRLYVDGRLVPSTNGQDGSNDIGSEGLAAGASAIQTFKWRAACGSHTVQAKADDENHVDESDETNNVTEIFSITVDCGMPPPPPSDTTAPTITFFSPSRGSVCSGSSVTLFWMSHDTGGSLFNRVEVWQNPGSLWTPVSSGDCSGSKPFNGSCAITPPATTQYGVHAIDNAGNCIAESGAHCGGVSSDSLDPRAPQGPDTVTVITAPGAPDLITFSNTTSSGTRVSWSAGSGATAYYLYRCSGNGCSRPGSPTASSVTSPYQDTGLSCGTPYTYWIESRNSCGSGVFSDPGAVTTSSCPPPNQPPSPPTISGSTSGNTTQTLSYTFTATDPENGDIEYLIEWESGVQSQWTQPYESGFPYGDSHRWTSQGTKCLKAQAKDALSQGTSAWTGCYTVTISAPLPVPDTLSSCKPLYPNHNSIPQNKLNFVFEGTKFRNINEFLEIVKNFVDLNSTDNEPGLFGQEPFKSNEDLFNFWYIDEINYCDNISDTNCNQKAVSNYNICNFEHKYYFRFFQKDSTPWTPYLGISNQDDLWIWSFKPRPFNEPLIDSRSYLVHEFGHVFNTKKLDLSYAPLLLDEYGGKPNYPNYDYILNQGPWAGKILPNVLVNQSVKTIEECKQNTHWKDLIGNGCGQDGVIDCISSYTSPQIDPIRVYENIECKPGYPDCYKEISCFEGALEFEKGVFRPSFNSIMNNKNYKLQAGFNLPSQRHLCRVFKAEIGNYKGVCSTLLATPFPKPFDTTPPTIINLSASGSPRPTVSWSVSDTGGSGLSFVQVWRASRGKYSSCAQVPGANFTPQNGKIAQSGSSSSGSWQEPSNLSSGAYCYGLHVNDQAGNYSTETPAQRPQVVIAPPNQPPSPPTISGPTSGNTTQTLSYTFTSRDPENGDIEYLIEWEPNVQSQWTQPYESGFPYGDSHRWTTTGTKCLKAQAKDALSQGTSAWSGCYNVTISAPPSQPDLIVEDIYPESGNTTLCVDEPERMRVRVKNQGNASAGASTTRFSENASVICNLTTPSLNAGLTSLPSCEWTPAATGARTLQATADQGGTVAESNEGNNSFSKTFSVSDCTPSDTTAPTIISFSPSTSSMCSGSSVTLSWEVNDTGGSGFNRVEVWQNPGSGWAPVSSGNCSGSKLALGSCSITPSATTPYGLHAIDNAGNCITESGSHCGGVSSDSLDPRAPQGPDTVTVNTSPGAPTGLTHTANTTGSITWSWNSVSGATSYNLTCNGATQPSTTSTSQTCSFSTANTQYAASVMANNSCGSSSASGNVNAYTSAAVPTWGTATPQCGAILWSWNANGNPSGTQYFVDTNAYDSSWQTGTTWTQTGVSGTITGQVKARNGDNDETALSTVLTGGPALSAPGNVTSLAESATAQTSITWGWSAVSGATSYDISVDGGAVVNQTGTSYQKTGLTCNTSHTISVMAKNTCGGGTGATDSATTSACPDTTPPTVISLSAGSPPRPTVSWSVSDAGGSNLAFVQVWRANRGSYSACSLVPGADFQQMPQGNPQNLRPGKGGSGSWQEPSNLSAGTYCYGLHVNDNAGNYSAESTTQRQQVVIAPPNQPPSPPTISGSTSGNTTQTLSYTFTSQDPENGDIEYLIEWEPNVQSQWTQPYESGFPYSDSHRWTTTGTKCLKAQAKDALSQGTSAWTGCYNVAISAPPPPSSCGNGICGPGETLATCAQDCVIVGGSRPDLTGSVPTPWPTSIALGQAATLNYQTFNSYSVPATNTFTEGLYVKLSSATMWPATPVSGQIKTVNGLGPYTSANGSFVWTPTVCGAYNVLVFVDMNNQVQEGNESNNFAPNATGRSVTVSCP